MNLVSASWQGLKIAPDQTHHVINGQPAYNARFSSVMKFHEPGYAPVQDRTGAFHINVEGRAAYPDRFLKTFGFYQGRAAVESSLGWYHITTNGSPLYSERYRWCGNYQEHRVVVKDNQGFFFHLDQDGKKIYQESFRYAGDFRDGRAVVQNDSGFHTHIDAKGALVHKQWFLDLDVFHKNFARAKDKQGWFHIDGDGIPLYPQRYLQIEHFYNGIARVETHHGSLLLINEKGEQVQILREDHLDEFHAVSGDLVSYWRFYTLQAADHFELFEYLPNTTQKLAKQMMISEESALKLLCGLEEMGYVNTLEPDHWLATNKGKFCQKNHMVSLKKAINFWKNEHLEAWKHLVYSLETGKPAFNHLFGKGYFDWLRDQPEKNEEYHDVLSTYSRKDYQRFSSIIDFSSFESILDVGGSKGVLLIDVLSRHQHLKGVLLDLPEVISLASIPSNLKNRIQSVPIHFFSSWPSLTSDCAVLSRVLHDWSDEEAVEILKKVSASLVSLPKSRLYVIENIHKPDSCQGSLLNLNMLVMTTGKERSLEEFKHLFDSSGFVLERVHPLNQVSSIIIAKKHITEGK